MFIPLLIASLLAGSSLCGQPIYKIELRNGQRFIGLIKQEEIHLNDGWEEFTLNPDSIVQVAFDGGLHGAIDAGSLEFSFVNDFELMVENPANGTETAIPWNEISTISKHASTEKPTRYHRKWEKLLEEEKSPEAFQSSEQTLLLKNLESAMISLQAKDAQIASLQEKAFQLQRVEQLWEGERIKNAFLEERIRTLEKEQGEASESFFAQSQALAGKLRSLADELYEAKQEAERLSAMNRQFNFALLQGESLIGELVLKEEDKDHLFIQGELSLTQAWAEHLSEDYRRLEELFDSLQVAFEKRGEETLLLKSANEELAVQIGEIKQQLAQESERFYSIKMEYSLEKEQMQHTIDKLTQSLNSLKSLVDHAVTSNKATHRVAEGENLNNISMRYYNTPSRWSDIYEVNKEVIEDIDHLRTGISIIIPE